MAQGTVMPAPKFTGFNNSGVVVSSGKLYTYSAGTSTPLATYSDVDLTVANANPVILDSAGRATVFLTASSYKFVLKDSSDNTLWTQDNVKAAAPFSVNLDITATFGVTVTAGQGVYLSNGSGSLTAGRWYLWDADLDYASNSALGLPIIGIVTADASAGDVGSVRVLGRADVTGPLTVGTSYYISGTAGALSSSAGTYSRLVGVADSTTSLAMTATSAPVPLASISGLGTNVATWLATPSSSNLAAAVTGETGSGALVFATSPSLVTPALGTPASGTLTNCSGLPAASVVAGTFGSGNYSITGTLALAPTKQLYLDGGNDTYIREVASDWMDFVVGGNSMLQLRNGVAVYLNLADVYMGATKRLYLDGGSNTYITEASADQIEFITGGSSRVKITSTGRVRMPDVYNVSGTGAALYIESDGNLFRIVSARKYKDNIRYHTVDGNAVYQLRPISYTLKAKPDAPEQIGFLAEDVEPVERRLVVYNDEGTPESLHYDRITVLLVAAVQDLQQRLTALSARGH
ncbi:MAG: tail fiber domain-containing protein [Planctomycetes bacterium]|nr:tail fiber domain-containing protein [Planctomycetota bacterium]